MKPEKPATDASEFRQRAEERLKNLTSHIDAPLSAHETQRLLQELKIHQIELEMQNEELQQAHMELETSQARYLDLYDMAPLGYVTVSEKGIILEANLAAASLLDLPRGKLIRHRLNRFIFKDDLPIYDLYCRQPFITTGSQDCELRMVQQDGAVFWVQLVATVVQQAGGTLEYRITLNNITERKQTEEVLKQQYLALEIANIQIKEQADSLVSIYEALDSVGLVVCDLEENDARVKIFNSGAEKLLGYRQEEVLGRMITLFYPPELMNSISSQFKKIQKGESMLSFDRNLVRKSGEQFPAIVSIHPFDYRDGRFRKAVGTFRDISELMRTQNQLQAINEELELRVEKRTRELQESQKKYVHAEKLSAIGQLSASIAHEFNNPLQGILTILKGLRKRAILEDEDRDLLEAAISESDRIKDLIRSLQAFNRPSSGRETMTDLHQILNSLLLMYKSALRNEKISLALDYAEKLPHVRAVPDQIKQVILNFLTNAVDACRVRGGVITVSTRQVDNQVAIAIKDTGVGITPEKMELIFQPFYTTKSEVKGTGLGLSVSYGIIKNHQGEIQVESMPGEGTTFTILLPIKGKQPVI